jgi:hypothetical protein
MKEQEINVKDGLVEKVDLLSDEERESRLDDIIQMINDPDTPLAPIKRMIAVELAKTSRLMIKFGNEVSLLEGLKIKALEAQVKALRELGKELMESDVLSKKDFLNFDGPKLAFVLEEFRQGAQDTLKKIGIDDGTTQQFLRHWRDMMLEREPKIRRATEKLEFEQTEKK